MKYLLLTCILLAGCGMPETARAARQAEQAVEGIGITIREVAPLLDGVKDDVQRTKLREAFQKIIKLVQSAKISLQPNLVYLSDGREIRVDTTSEQAAKATDTFCQKAAIQSGRAAVEVEQRMEWEQTLLSFVDPNNLEGLLTGLSVLLFGSGTVGLIVARTLKAFQTHKAALQDALMYGKEGLKINPDDNRNIEKLKEQHAARQRARGTHSLIAEQLTRIKQHGPHA
jgi:hypothetical protein